MLCSICRGKGLCGMLCPIVARFNKVKIKELFIGETPPAVFVGRFGYPNIFTGVLSSPEENVNILDDPETWYEKGFQINDVLDIRSRLIYSRVKTSVKTRNKIIEIQQEIAQSKRPCDIEVELKRRPTLKLHFYLYSAPVSSPAPLKNIRLVDNPRIPRIVDKITSDYDLEAEDSVEILYKRGIKISTIQKIFSCGLLGVKPQRKLVPTRWAITGVDDIVSRKLIEKIKDYPPIDKPILFSNTYLGNHYEILLIPRQWSYELIEAKFPGSVWNFKGETIKLLSDYEDHFGRKYYVEETAGGYYATRLGVCEYLYRVRRQATAFVIRECLPSYFAPLGVWVVRECVRHAFDKPGIEFETVEEALKEIRKRLKLRWEDVERKSKLLKEMKVQKKVVEFLN